MEKRKSIQEKWKECKVHLQIWTQETRSDLLVHIDVGDTDG